MKRINPKTQKPFKHGDIREDGYIFLQYHFTKPVKQNGYYIEDWRNPQSFAKTNKQKSVRQFKNKPEHNRACLKWMKQNPDKVNATNAKRRAFKLQRTPKWLTQKHLDDISHFYKQARELTKTTGIIHHVDHIIPLKGKTVSGLHVPSNLQVIPASDNCSKGNAYS